MHRPQRTWIAIALLAVLVLALVAAFAWGRKGSSATTVPADEPNGSISVAFCPECDATLNNLIKGGGDIDCALYDVGKETGELLQAARADVVTDPDTKPAYGEPAPRSKTFPGLMHDKFCIFNSTVLFTGSYNPTDNGEKNQNNVLTIVSARLAHNYAIELAVLKTGKPSSARKGIIHDGTIGGIRVENYFCPEDRCEDEALAELAAAQSEIRFMTYSFTSDPIGDLLERKRTLGIDVQGVCDASQLNDFNECERLGATVWRGGGLLHHKVFIIDRSVVITGSYNPTGNGNRANNENILIIHDPAIAAQFLTEYERIAAGAE